jgi:Zn-dependent peptidase ImmA (M78 family)
MGTDKDNVLNTITLYNTVGQELEDILQAQEKSKSDFEKFMGWENRDFASIKKLSNADISMICAYFDISGLDNYLRNFQDDYKKTEKKALFDYKESRKLFPKLKGVVRMLNGEYTDGIDVLDDISRFFDVEDEGEIIKKADDLVALYRTANFNPDGLNLYAWMRRGELDFSKLNIRHYNKESFEEWIGKGEWKNHLTDTGYFKSLPEIFQKFGVGLVYTPYLNKTVYGAVRWFNGVPLIQLSDREKSLAVCWYTLFHEIGHVLLHENDIIFEGEINETKSKASQKETEANAYAYKMLFNGDELRKYIFSKKGKTVHDAFVSDTAEEFNVPAIFVAYWMLKAQIGRGSGSKHIPKMTFDNLM